MRLVIIIALLTKGLWAQPGHGVEQRIVNGAVAAEGQFPHQISLRLNGDHQCGGSIISRYYILTAAHCAGGEDEEGIYQLFKPDYLTIRAGSTNRLKGGVIKRVANITVHELYMSDSVFNDLALLKLESPLIYSRYIQPIALPLSEVPVGSDITISGWGHLKTGGDTPLKLQYINLVALSRQECLDMLALNTIALICLAHPEGKGACNGDSGGPAIYNGELIGVAGFVAGTCGSDKPDGYAKVFYHLDWIKEHSDL